MKKEIFEKGFYHVFTKSISEYIIFREESDYMRMIEAFEFYKFKRNRSFSYYKRLSEEDKGKLYKGERLVKIIGYCLMPTHIHLIIYNEIKNGISIFMKNLLDSYTRYFNTKIKRKGPLWESRFKIVVIENDEQLLHLTRYIHLNPVTAFLVEKPEDWEFSSYKEYLNHIIKKVCEFEDIIEIKENDYKAFVEDRISYQRELAKIKKLIID
ncbi:MAG: transposase [bacterium]|nr:transposase [bacterium]MDW8163785.1 transposase [Candidatus Omnitrophota bacterium]